MALASGLEVGSGSPTGIAGEAQSGFTEGLSGLSQAQSRKEAADPNKELKDEFEKLQRELQMLKKTTREKLLPLGGDDETQGQVDSAH